VQIENGRVWIYPSRSATFYRLYDKFGAQMFQGTISALCSDKAISYKMKDRRLTHIGPASNGIFGSEVETEEGSA
jgi:hypothetical protein